MILGTGGHAVSTASLAEQCGYYVSCFLSLQEASGELYGREIRSLRSIRPNSRISVAVAVGDNFLRERCVNDVLSFTNNNSIEVVFPNLLHPSCHIGSHTTLGEGNLLFPGANLGSHVQIENFVTLNHLSSLDHESTIGSFSSLAPGAVSGGRVKIGNRSALMIHSAVSHGVSIGNDVIIAANSFVKEDVNDNSLVAGSPAKFVRVQRVGDPYL
jgi:sugar O-acyltransferase (sialic acid O-acetyltransferase NeuD family)